MTFLFGVGCTVVAEDCRCLFAVVVDRPVTGDTNVDLAGFCGDGCTVVGGGMDGGATIKSSIISDGSREAEVSLCLLK